MTIAVNVEEIDTIGKMANSIQNILYQFSVIEKNHPNLDNDLQSQLDFLKKQVIFLKEDITKVREMS